MTVINYYQNTPSADCINCITLYFNRVTISYLNEIRQTQLFCFFYVI